MGANFQVQVLQTVGKQKHTKTTRGFGLVSFLQDLGQMPPPTRANDLAYWAAALVNPLPALGISMNGEGKN